MDVPLLTDDFKEFLRSLNAAHVESLVVGAYAVGYHGYPRAAGRHRISTILKTCRSVNQKNQNR